MRGMLARIGIALGLAASWILPVGAAVPEPRSPLAISASAPIVVPAPRSESPSLEAAAQVLPESRRLRPAQAPRIPGRPAPSIHRGPADPGPAAPGGQPQEAAAAGVPTLRAPGEAPLRAWIDRPRTFSPQGLKPEQGGQTGPPGTRVSA